MDKKPMTTKYDIAKAKRHSKENLSWTFQFNTTTVANMLVIGVLLLVFFGIEQTNVMIHYGYEQVKYGPITTTFYIFLFSLSLYMFSKFALQIRHRMLERKGLEELAAQYGKDDPISLALLLVPTLLHVGSMLFTKNANSDTFVYELILSAISLILLILFIESNFLSDQSESIILKFMKKRNIVGSQADKLDDQLYRSDLYTRAILALVIILVIIYFILSNNQVEPFGGQISIAILDIILLFLICLRMLVLAVFVFWKYLFPFNTTVNDLTEHLEDKDLYWMDKLDAIEFKYLNNLQFSKQWWFSRANVVSFISLIALSLFVVYGYFVPNIGYNEIIKFPHTQVKGKALQPSANKDIERMDLVQYTIGWLEERKDKKDENIYLLAGQGGGSRAGFWTAAILRQLDSTYNNFYDNLFAVSTVSGSSVGAGIFLNHKKNVNADSIYKDNFNEQSLTGFYNTDFVTSSAMRLLFLNPFHKILGASNFKNRNNQLIQEENMSFRKHFYNNKVDNSKLKDHKSEFELIDDDSPSYDHPLFLVNTYNVDTKKKSVVSPVDLPENYYHEDLLDSLGNERLLCGEVINLSQMFPMMSASARVNSRHYYDGGIYDNSGLSTLRDVYKTLRVLRDEFSEERKIVIFYAENSHEVHHPVRTRSPSGFSIFSEATSGSIFHANTGRHITKLHSSVRQVGDLFVDSLFANQDTITLNRWLSKTDCKRMWQTIKVRVDSAKVVDLMKEKGRNRAPQTSSLSVYFNPGESKISEFDMDKIRKLLENIDPELITLRAYSDSEVNLIKHDSILLKERISAVRSILSDTFNINQIKITSSEPYEKGDDRLTRQLNRRVDLNFTFYTVKKAYFAPPK